MNTQELKTDYWKKLQKTVPPSVHYDSATDTLYVYFSPEEKERIISHFVDENVSFLYRRSDKEIVGMRIEYFKAAFLGDVSIDKKWTLSNTGSQLCGIEDLNFYVKSVETKPIPLRRRASKPLEPEVKVDPVFAPCPA